MKKILGLIILGLNLNSYCQSIGVEKTIFGIQTGLAGIWINNETKLSNVVALRSEIGIEKDFFVGDHYDRTGFILQPVITLEPRYYYNIVDRNSTGKKTSKNSANYFSLKTSYHPDWFVMNLDASTTKTADLSICPTWGLKRQIGDNFTYEAGIGVGYRIVYLKANYFNGTTQNVDGIAKNRNQYTPYLNLRIGYTL